jgi:hypothetical protein
MPCKHEWKTAAWVHWNSLPSSSELRVVLAESAIGIVMLMLMGDETEKNN